MRSARTSPLISRSAAPRAIAALIALVTLAALAALPACTDPPPPVEPTDRIVLGRPSPPAQAATDANTKPPEESPPLPEQIAVAEPRPPAAPPLDPGVRDGRATRTRPRTRALLVVELQQLEALFSATPRESPDRPLIMRRLAEGYGELEAAADREIAERRTPNLAQSARLRDGARAKVLKLYRVLVDEYPKHCAHPELAGSEAGGGCIDEVLYYLGYEHEQAHDFESARKTYFQLIKEFPASRFLPYAYFGFGDMFFEAALEDPAKWDLAVKCYEKVLEMKESPIAPYAEARLALICEKTQGQNGPRSGCKGGQGTNNPRLGW